MNPVEELLSTAVQNGIFPGAAYAIWKDGKLIQGAVGNHLYDPASQRVTVNTVWDLASVSKVIGTTSAAILLVQDGLLDLDHPVIKVIPEFGINGKEHVSFRNLMVHDSGLIAFRPYHKTFSNSSDVMTAIYTEKFEYETGAKTVYSDLNMILLAEAMRRLTGKTLDELLRERVFKSLGMKHTGYFRQDKSTFVANVLRRDCSPTEVTEPWRVSLRRRRYGDLGTSELFGDKPEFIQGEVHDPTATVLDGVAGHAGLFSTVGDLCTFMANYISDRPKLFDPKQVAKFTKRQNAKSTRGLGWDTKSPQGSSAGKHFGQRSFGHTGYTGTSIWCDPDANLFAILLANRVHPTSQNTKILAFRPTFHDAVWSLS